MPTSRSVIPATLFLLALGASALAAPVPNVIPTSGAFWTGGPPFSDEDFGDCLATGDVNGDGLSDVLVGAPGWDGSRGRVLLYMGSASEGLSAAPAWILEGDPTGRLGNSVAVGDVNRDGYADVLVAEPGAQDGRGRVRLYLGSRRGPRSSPFWDVIGNVDEGLGSTAAFAGDVNHDGYADVLTGSFFMNAMSLQMSVRLYFGRPGRLDRDPAWVLPGRYACDGIGDVNGDGFDDVATHGIPAPDPERPGGTTVFYGSRHGLSAIPSWAARWSSSFAGRGDVNGDGFGDLVLGQGADDSVRLYLGSANGLSANPSWQASDGSPDFGRSVSIGDVNRDGISDVAVSSPSHMEPGALAPWVFVYLGSRSLPRTTPSWRDTNEVPSSVGPVALGADVDGDGTNEVLFTDTMSQRLCLYRLGPGYPAPIVVHEPVAALVPSGTPLTLEADIVDSTHSVARGEIHYRFVEDFAFQPPIRMELVSGSHYRGTIPTPTEFHAGLVYSIQGVDDYGLVGATELVGVDYEYAAEAAGTERFALRVGSALGFAGEQFLFRTARPGPAHIRLFDVSGRLIATLMDVPDLAPGDHKLEVSPGILARSGVYFYRAETSAGISTGRLVHVR